MNTADDWKREAEDAKPCPYCKGRGWIIDRNAPSGGSPCGCDEPSGGEGWGEINRTASHLVLA